ncbi:Ig-like domain-containing protein [Anaeromyxobacter paludicola]|uniref:SbsA Ig-like domain-containing protein n=1 Tax=Anaeromyxobacter paludicola TaxID=2918171 RepID=A0ABM7XC18_9BACT|nr:Ig-like domain-containing protein [Anaeromyxobacter paludicola]BDG09376.1 hypothetical protein AMPC_24890 [Anaeromyxobacter paludicola]
MPGDCRAGDFTVEAPYAVQEGAVVYAGPTLVLRLHFAVDTPKSFALTLNGMSPFTTVTETIIVADTSTLPEGTYLLRAEATYCEDRVVTHALTVEVDHTAPALTWTPAPGEGDLTGVTELVGQAAEPLDPTTGPLDVRVTRAEGDPLLPPYTVDVDPPSGSIRLRFAAPLDFANAVGAQVFATDRAGNATPAASWATWTQPPLTLALDGGELEYARGVKSYAVALGGGRAEKVVLRAASPVSGEAPAVLELREPPYAFTLDTSALSEETWTVHAEATRGGRTFSSPVRWLAVDRTRPQAVGCQAAYSSPANVYREEPLLLSFSEPMSAASLEAAVTLRGGSGRLLPRTLELDPRGYQLSVRAAPDESGTETLALGADARDPAGNPLLDPRSCTVSFPEWQEPGNGYSVYGETSPSLALGGPMPGMGARASIAALGMFSASSSTLSEYGPWMTGALPYELSAVAAAVDAQDRLVLAWVRVVGGERRLELARSAASFWTAGTILPVSESGANADAVALAFGPDGQPVVAWTEQRAEGYAVQVRRWDGAAWAPFGPAAPLNGSPSLAAAAPALRLDGAGRPVVAWQEAAGPGQTVVRVRRFTGASWSEPLGDRLGGEALAASAPALALDAEERPVLAWAEPVDGTVQVRAAVFADGGWAALGAPVSAGPGLSAHSPSLATGGGSLFLATVDATGGMESIQVRRWDAGAWAPLGGPLRATASDPAATPSLAVDSNGRPAVAWSERSGIQFRRYNR